MASRGLEAAHPAAGRAPFGPGHMAFITWGVRVDSGGMTLAMLRRARMFIDAGSGPITLFTFENTGDTQHVAAELRALGRINDQVELVNLFDALRAQPSVSAAASKRAPKPELLMPIAHDEPFESVYTEHGGTRVEVSRIRRAADGETVLQIDYLRADGSLMVSDRRDLRERGVLGKRSIVVCDSNGTPMRAWSRATPFYQWMLTRVITERFGSDPVTLMIDSKTVATPLADYRRKQVLTVYVVHGSHSAGPNEDGREQLFESRHRAITSLASFDVVTVLTKSQRRDLKRLLGFIPNVTTIPNSTALPALTSGDSRDEGAQASADLIRQRGRGAFVGVLGERKRADLAIDAIALANSSGSGAQPITLDIYGDGDEREALEQRIAELNAQRAITLHGYTTNAAERLAAASFLLFTSEAEGFGLVLVEAMAVGCIPIAFDVRYGPSDIIRHGVDGFLVPFGDVSAMARCIEEIQRMAEEQLERMREAARTSARRFADQSVVLLWQRALRRAWRQKPSVFWRALRKQQARVNERHLRRSQPVVLPPR